jgi:hypothetical protein
VSARERRFGFDFEDRYRKLLAVIGVRSDNSWVEVGEDSLLCRFGPWSLETPLSNVTCVSETGPYRAYRAIGPRGSFADMGVTFGTTTRGGLCIEFADAVPALVPGGLLRHPGATVTVADAGGLRDLLVERCGL